MLAAIALQVPQSRWRSSISGSLDHRDVAANAIVAIPNRGRHAGVDRRCAGSRSRSFNKRTRELCERPMRPRNLYPLGSGGGNYAISQLHASITGAGALLGERWQSQDGGCRQPGAARLQFQARERRPVHGHSHAKRSGALCEDARPDAGFPQGTHSRTGRKAGSGERRGILHRQSRNATSGKLHGCACAARDFADTTYWGVHVFPATNSKGETRFIKFKVVPVGGKVTPAGDETRIKPDDLLLDDLNSRVAKGYIRFSVMALLDRPGDPIMDVTIRWPNEDRREAVRLGTIVIAGIELNRVCDAFMFDPANLAEGVGHPPDEIFAARHAACAISLAKRR